MSSRKHCRYPAFRQINGRHPYKAAVPDGFVDYGVRRRRDGEVAFFNFDLAIEMGLIPRRHPHRLNTALRSAILDTFCLKIINEHDILRRVPIPARDRRSGRYMATRYLQLQHPGRTGRTSGDGRGIWNGIFEGGERTWDVSSCGTGVTSLCPATASELEFFRSGSEHASYGCGTAGLDEGLSGMLMSEIFHRNGIPTERVLAVIALPHGRAINVRAAPSLIRPSHFLAHLKQGNLEALRGCVDLFIDRQVENGDAPRTRGRRRRYEFFATEFARNMARLVAQFESEYIFCWIDWDGDNLLANGGIIDYGSVRQLGLFHRDYRFDDGPRWSTTLAQQRGKARSLVRCIAQIRDYLIDGKRRALSRYRRDRALRVFDAEFRSAIDQLLLEKMGFCPQTAGALRRREPRLLARFARAYRHFERARARRGEVRVPDGISWNAIFSTRDLLRELPCRYRERAEPVGPRAFIEIAASDYASTRDRIPSAHRCRMSREFELRYLELIGAAARLERVEPCDLLVTIEKRSSCINRRARITGDGIDYVTSRLQRQWRRLSSAKFHALIEAFIDSQDRRPGAPASPRSKTSLSHLLEDLESEVHQFRHGL